MGNEKTKWTLLRVTLQVIVFLLVITVGVFITSTVFDLIAEKYTTIQHELNSCKVFVLLLIWAAIATDVDAGYRKWEES